MSSNVQTEVNVIPIPVHIKQNTGQFRLKNEAIISCDNGARSEAHMLASSLSKATGYNLHCRNEEARDRASIILDLDSKLKDLGDEGYRLEVTEKQVRITASKTAGLFYGTQTLLQLLPPEAFSSSVIPSAEWTIPCVEIEDQPRYSWRGSLLDCCRHFYSVEFVKKYIDLLSMHKMNVLHWHLTEDQGWRIEIKKYPKLTEVGAWRNENGTRYGGFYSQKEIKEVVKYAQERHVTVVPEIELPGHAMAAITAYPEFSCTGGPFEVQTGWGVFPDVYCGGNDATFKFLETILDEVMGLFPSKYIHIGGDECPKARWKTCPKCQARIKAEGLKDEFELQSYFVRRVEKHLNRKGRSLIGWDEILEGGLAPNAVVQSWRGIEGGIAAAKDGHDVIMSPTSHCYLDYGYGSISTERAYSYEPTPGVLNETEAKHVLGVEGNLWSEWTATSRDVERQVFPRLNALSEVAWSPKDRRNWLDFQARLMVDLKRMDFLDVAYYHDPLLGTARIGEWSPKTVQTEYQQVDFNLPSGLNLTFPLEVTFVYSGGEHALSVQSLELLEDGVSIAKDAHLAWCGGQVRDNVFTFKVSSLKAGSSYQLRASLKGEGGHDSYGTVAVKVKS